MRRLNPLAKIFYLASDDLETIGVSPFIISEFQKNAVLLDGAFLPSKLLAASMPAGLKLSYVPHGIDADLDSLVGANPYQAGLNAVSVGSMLFDPQFFRVATTHFPDIKFHVIGSGASREQLPEPLVIYSEMPFEDTLSYIKYAVFGIAPYRQAHAPYYLCDTSMKLMQYEYFGLPAVCPEFAVGETHGLRFGYEPGNEQSIISAIRCALRAHRGGGERPLTWSEVTDRILQPDDYADTEI
jgi:2-beta-glucuronyltransferase